MSTDSYWTKLHDLYSDTEWIAKPSIFAETVAESIPHRGNLLELGAGLGQDSVYFESLGFSVTATDLTIEKLTSLDVDTVTVDRVDLRQELPYDDQAYDVVYAHLSLHYFDEETTNKIFREIYRVLKPGGYLAFFVNSVQDPEYDAKYEIEQHYCNIDGTMKRYFDIKDAEHFTHAFKQLMLDDQGETYKDRAKGVHNLVRYIGIK